MNDITSEIFSKLDRASLIQELEPRDRTTHYSILCPQCNKREAFIYKDSTQLVCNRKNNCGFTSSLWDYVKEKKGLSQSETLKELAQAAGVVLTNRESYTEESLEKKRKKGNLLELAKEIFIRELNQSNNIGNAYLLSRGYTAEEIDALELGFIPPPKVLLERLQNKGFSPDEMRDAGLITSGFGETHLVSIPYKAPSGELKGFIVRALDPEIKPKYKYNTGLTLDTLFGLSTAKKEKSLVIVEGFLDSLISQARGFPQVVATGGSTLSDKQIESTLQFGKKNFILALDSDEAGKKGIEKAILALEARGLFSCVLTLPKPFKDPDALLCSEEGPRLFSEAIEEAQSSGGSFRWLANKLLEENNPETDLGRHQIYVQLLELSNRLHSSLAVKEFIEPIAQALDVSPEALIEEVKTSQEKTAQESLVKATETAFNDSLKALKTRSNPEEFFGLLEERFEGLKANYFKASTTRSQSTAEAFREKIKRDSQRVKGQLLGYKLNRLPELAKELDGIQPGFTIIGADSNVGKTALLSTIGLDLLQSNPETKIIYFSLDDPKDTIFNRFLGILTRLNFNPIKFGMQQENQEDNDKLLRAYTIIEQLAEEDRLDLKDISEVQTINQIEQLIRGKGAENLIVLIDGLYNAEVEGRYDGHREQNIERANQVKRLTTVYKIPVITTAEVKKEKRDGKPLELSDLMESGKYAYNCDLALLLWNPKDSDSNAETIEVYLKAAKNKLSGFKDTRSLYFTRACGLLSEMTPDSTSFNPFYKSLT